MHERMSEKVAANPLKYGHEGSQNSGEKGNQQGNNFSSCLSLLYTAKSSMSLLQHSSKLDNTSNERLKKEYTVEKRLGPAVRMKKENFQTLRDDQKTRNIT